MSHNRDALVATIRELLADFSTIQTTYTEDAEVVADGLVAAGWVITKRDEPERPIFCPACARFHPVVHDG